MKRFRTGLLTYHEPGDTCEYNLEIEFTDNPGGSEHYKAFTTTS